MVCYKQITVMNEWTPLYSQQHAERKKKYNNYTTQGCNNNINNHLTAVCPGQPGVGRYQKKHSLVLFILTLMTLLSTLSFHSFSLLISSSSVSVITAKSSAYSSSQGRATLNSLDIASMTIMNNNGLNPEPWCIPTFTSKNLCYYHRLFWRLFLHLYI